MLDLDPIKARLDAACPGPWKGGTLRDPLIGDCYMLLRADDPIVVAATLRLQYGDNDTAVMLLHSRADMDAMVAEIERLRADNDQLRDERQQAVAWLHVESARAHKYYDDAEIELKCAERVRISTWLRNEPEKLVACDGNRHADGKPCLVLAPMSLPEIADAIERGDYGGKP
jgi:hypothetical protein